MELGPSTIPSLVAAASCTTVVKEENDDVGADKTNLIINYLPQQMSGEEVQSLFSTVGVVESCKLIKDRATGQSLGYGFVKYDNPVDAHRAISQLNGLRMQNKTIKVSYARPSSESIKNANLYVSGLPTTMSPDDVHTMFAEFGTIITSRILTEQNGTSKGVCFVRYNSKTEAEAAIAKLHGSVAPNGTATLIVKLANTPQQQHGYHPPHHVDMVGAHHQLPPVPSPMSLLHQHRPFIPPGGFSMPTSVLRTLSGGHQRFEGPPPPPHYRMSSTGSSNNSYSSSQRSPTTFKGGPMYQQLGGGGRYRYSPLATNSTSGSIPVLGPSTAVMGGLLPQSVLSQPFNPSRPQVTPMNGRGGGGFTLFVYNLEPDMQEATLWQLFGPFGAVTSVKIIREQETGKCRGYGFVTLTHQEDAVQAINQLNGTMVKERQLQVSFKRERK